jgi:perosamine synthetase
MNNINEKTENKAIKIIHLSSPYIEQEDIDAVVNVMKTRWLAFGQKLKEFEEKMARYAGTKYAVALNSGTSALHCAIAALGIKEGDEVITTPFTFVASANCILFERATPVFADINKHTFTLDPAKVEEKITPRTKAIVDVDIFGRPSDKDALKKIAEKHNLKIIEDAAEAIGAEYKGKKVGSFFDCAIFAFYPNKQITTGEGGMLLTNNEHIAEITRSLRNQGRDPQGTRLNHVRLGYNYRISDINCALGISQLNKIETILTKRAQVAQKYTKILSNAQLKGVTLPLPSTTEKKVSWFVYVIQVQQRDIFMNELKARGVQCAPYFSSLHLTQLYKEKFGYNGGEFPICEKVASSTLALPFYTAMSDEDIRYVCKKVIEVQALINE